MKQKHFPRRAALPALCYGAAALVWLALCGSLLLGDWAARACGRMERRVLEPQAFELVSAEWTADGVLTAQTPDPQLIWINSGGEVVRTVTLTAAYSTLPGEMCLYYIEQPGEAFGADKRVFPRDNGDGTWTFTLPRADVYALRLDPCSVVCAATGFSVEFNTPWAAWRYFVPSWRQLFWLALLPGLVSSALDVALCAARAWQRRAKP